MNANFVPDSQTGCEDVERMKILLNPLRHCLSAFYNNVTNVLFQIYFHVVISSQQKEIRLRLHSL